MDHQIKEKIYEIKWLQEHDYYVGEAHEEVLPEYLEHLIDKGFTIVSVHLK